MLIRNSKIERTRLEINSKEKLKQKLLPFRRNILIDPFSVVYYHIFHYCGSS